MNANPGIGMLLSIAGFIAIAIAVWDGFSTRRFIQSAQRTQGTVTALYAGPAHPEIEYVDENGARQTFPGTGWIAHKQGDLVQVLFIDRGDDHAAKLDEWGSLWFSACMTGVTGTAVLLAGVYLIWRR